ncbi:hypothetical protein E2C01_101664 [Portunus trituberculatus]|uniref:Uncharacterized protein n=1 Tax=Portunus trituberculatus TaxID=210409 RepID=A0A5B7KBA6_PORTR|nr:hypothetical protein [Portunus trituberculatus]
MRRRAWGSEHWCVGNAMEIQHDPLMCLSLAGLCVAMTCARAALLIGGGHGDALPGE